MRKNRKRSTKMSVTASRSMHFGAVIVMLFVMVIVNLLAGSRCDQMMKSIGEKENLLAKLEKERERESGRWEQAKTDENLDRMLPHLGMSMKYPHSTQIVRMGGDGVPERGQPSIRYAIQRAARSPEAGNAKVKSATTRRRR